MTQTINQNKMGTQPVLKLLISMSLPAMFSMVIQSLYNIVDSIFVAKIGQEALTAVSIAYPFQIFLIAIATGTGVGVNSLVSRRLGEGKIEEANSAATHGMFLSLVGSLVFIGIGIFAVEPFFRASTTNEAVIKYGIEYTSTVMIFSFGVLIQITIEKILQATGSMIFPMLFMLTGAITNIILDPLFIFGIGPFPEWGVFGAAVATVIGQIASMIFAVIVLFCKKHDVKISFKNFRPKAETMKNIYAVALPSIVMQTIASVLVVCLNTILISFTEAAVNVLGIYYKVQSFIFMPIFGLTYGAMPIMGYNYGAKNKKRLMSTLKYSCVLSVIIMFVGTIIFWFFPQYLLQMFDAPPETMKIGITALKIISLSFVLAGPDIMISTMFQAIGKGFHSLAMSVLRQLVFILPAAYLLSFLGLDYIWFCYPISEIGAIIAIIILMIRVNKKELSKLG